MQSPRRRRTLTRVSCRLIWPSLTAAAMAAAITVTGIAEPAAAAAAATAPASHSARVAHPVDPDFGTVRAESASEAVALTTLAATAETTLNTLTELAESGRLTLPEANVSGPALHDLLRQAAVRLAEADSNLSAQALRQRRRTQRSGVLSSIFDKIGPDDHFKGSRRLKADDLQVGDVLVSTTSAVISQIIKVATWGQYSHAALYVGDGQVVDATADGVKQRSLKTFLGEASKVGVLRAKRVASTVTRQVVEHARKLIGTQYNYQGLAGMALDRMACFAKNTLDAARCLRSVASVPKPFMNSNSYFCSQLVDTAWRRAGIKLFRQNGATPIDFVNLAVRGGSSAPIRIVGRLK